MKDLRDPKDLQIDDIKRISLCRGVLEVETLGVGFRGWGLDFRIPGSGFREEKESQNCPMFSKIEWVRPTPHRFVIQEYLAHKRQPPPLGPP